ncbi:sucrase/ferredoxin-like family protein [Rhodotorula toruloides]|uniref:Sucrase/ferredoxin-like family protein n=1 Tax=Rhodotorula toruloides TaxID=5286 RepID=A0A511KQI3_RHOTO|nr:sucrase/ferredoxin-like family protein [Rhodotorula toruloides]
MAGIPDRPAPPAALVDALRTAGVPLESLADACKACDGCDDEADLEDLAYPKGFDVDLDSQMLGELKPLGRQILVSSGKSDWIREVTDDFDSIPGLVKVAYDEATTKPSGGLLSKVGGKLFQGGKGKEEEKGKRGLPGVHPSKAAAPADVAASSRLSILSSSFVSHSDQAHKESVIVLPDYKVVHDVEPTRPAVDELVQRYLRPEAGRAGSGEGTLRSWPLPYQAVILLCSHRKRDKRCSIAAPLLISQFHIHLDKHGLHVDERGEDLAEGPAIEEWEGGEEERSRKLEEKLKEGTGVESGRVGLFKVSHIGGHRYAGNVIIYFRNGSSIWYGRVTPPDVAAIVDRTIIHGKVIPELLRGGLGLAGKTGPRGVLEW